MRIGCNGFSRSTRTGALSLYPQLLSSQIPPLFRGEAQFSSQQTGGMSLPTKTVRGLPPFWFLHEYVCGL